MCARSCREQAQQCARGLAGLLDHVVGSREQRGWHCDAESLGGLKVDNKLIFGRRLDWKVRWLLTLENAIDVTGRLSILIDYVSPKAHQASAGDEGTLEVNGGQLVPIRKIDDQIAMKHRQRASSQYQAAIR